MATEREILEIWLKLKGARAFAAETTRAIGTMDKTTKATKKVAKATDEHGKAADKAAKKTKSLGDAFGNSNKKAGTFRQSLTIMRKSLVGLTAASSAFVAISFAKSALDFEDAMAKVKATSEGEKGFNPKMFTRMQDAAMEWGERSKFSSTEVAQGLYELTTAGLTSQQALDALGGTTTLAAAAGVDMATAAKIQAGAINQFGLSANKSTMVADLLVEAVKAGSAEIDDLGESLKYIGPVSKAFGTDIHDTVVALTLLGKVGIKGSQAGTSLRTMFVRMSRPTKMVKQGFKDLGISQDELFTKSGKLLPLPQLLDKLRTSMAKVGGRVGRRALSQITGTEALTAVLNLVEKSGKPWDEMSKRMDKSRGAAKRFSDTMMATTRGSMDQFVNAIQNLAVKALIKYSPQIQKFFHMLQAGVTSLSDPSSRLRKILKPFISILSSLLSIAMTLGRAALPAFKVALVPIVILGRIFAKIFKFVARVLKPLTPILSGVALGLIAVYGGAMLVRQGFLLFSKVMFLIVKLLSMSPLGMIIFTVVALAFGLYQLYKRSEKFRSAVQALWWGIRKAFGFIWDIMKSVFNWVKDNWPLLLTILFGPFGLAVSLIIKKWDTVSGAFRTAWNTIKTIFWTAWHWIDKHVFEPLRDAYDLVKNILTLGGLFGGTSDADRKKAQEWLQNLPGGASIIDGAAAGGIINRGGLTMVGEAGPEVLNLPTAAQVIPLPKVTDVGALDLSGAFGPDTITTQVYLDRRQIAEATHSYVKGRQARR